MQNNVTINIDVLLLFHNEFQYYFKLIKKKCPNLLAEKESKVRKEIANKLKLVLTYYCKKLVALNKTILSL